MAGAEPRSRTRDYPLTLDELEGRNGTDHKMLWVPERSGYPTAVFTGSLTVGPAAGAVILTVYSDDGWILSLGPGPGGAQPVHTAPPALGPRTQEI